MSARDDILRSIRGSLHRTGPLEESVCHALDERMEAHEVHVQPVVEGALTERFVAKLEAAAGTLTRVAAPAEVPGAITDYLNRQDLAPKLVMASDPMLADLPWSDELVIERRVANKDDRVAVTGAFAGVAETGSLVLVSGPQSPTSLNFLPDVHIVVLARERIVRHIEDLWSLLRAELAGMPRTVNFITGPSRTADIEQTIQLGAHGPRNVHVIVVES